MRRYRYPVKDLGKVGFHRHELRFVERTQHLEVWAPSDGPRPQFDILKARIPMEAVHAVVPHGSIEPVFNTAPDGSTHVWSPGKKQWVPLADV